MGVFKRSTNYAKRAEEYLKELAGNGYDLNLPKLSEKLEKAGMPAEKIARERLDRHYQGLIAVANYLQENKKPEQLSSKEKYLLSYADMVRDTIGRSTLPRYTDGDLKEIYRLAMQNRDILGKMTRLTGSRREQDKKPAPSLGRIKELTEQLGDDDYSKREEASGELARMKGNVDVAEALKKASEQRDDLERKRRAEDLLRNIGIDPQHMELERLLKDWLEPNVPEKARSQSNPDRKQNLQSEHVNTRDALAAAPPPTPPGNLAAGKKSPGLNT